MGRRETAAAARGFTLVEMLTAIVVAGMLLVIALPPFRAVRRSVQLDGAAYQLAGDLRRAQTEAIKRNQSVQLLKTGASTYSIDFLGSRSFDASVTFGGGSATSVRMASFGPPTTPAAFTVSHQGQLKTVTVSAAGMVSVQ